MRVLLIFLFSVSAIAQDNTVSGFSSSFMSNMINDNKPLTGNILFNDINLRRNTLYNPSNFTCGADGLTKFKYKPAKVWEWDLVLTAQISPKKDFTTTDNRLPGDYIRASKFDSVYGSHAEYADLTQFNPTQLYGVAENLSPHLATGGTANPINAYSMLLLKSASQHVSIDPNNYNNYEAGGHEAITNFIADNIKAQNFTEDQVLQTIAQIKSAFYQNYNDPRNFSDEADNNNRYIGQMINGFFDYGNTGDENNNGGVCDDIAAVGCDIYSKIYPDRDCLVFNIAATDVFHEVMVVGNGTDDYTVVDGSSITNVKGSRFLSSNVTENPYMTREQGMNIRVQGVKDGKLNDLYVLKTEYGVFMDELMSNPDDPAVNINGDLDAKNYHTVMFKALGEVVKENDKKMQGLDTGVGQTKMVDGTQIVAVYARYNKYFDRDKLSGFNIGLANSNAFLSGEENFSRPAGFFGPATTGTHDHSFYMNRSHLNMGLNFGKIIYKDPNWNVSAQGYAGLHLMFGVGSYKRNVSQTDGVDPNITDSWVYGNKSYTGINGDGNFETGAKFKFNYQNDKKTTFVNGSVQPRFQLGSTNYSGMHNFLGDASALKNMSLRYQQVDANLQVQQKVGDNTSLVLNNSYRNTNIGGFVSNSVGVNVSAPAGIEYKVYVGHLTPTKGNKTKENWLNAPDQQGLFVGGEVDINSKYKVNASLNQDYTVGKTYFQLGTTIRPFKIKKRVPAKIKFK